MDYPPGTRNSRTVVIVTSVVAQTFHLKLRCVVRSSAARHLSDEIKKKKKRNNENINLLT